MVESSKSKPSPGEEKLSCRMSGDLRKDELSNQGTPEAEDGACGSAAEVAESLRVLEQQRAVKEEYKSIIQSVTRSEGTEEAEEREGDDVSLSSSSTQRVQRARLSSRALLRQLSTRLRKSDPDLVSLRQLYGPSQAVEGIRPILQEILSSERVFVERLRLFRNCYYLPLEYSLSPSIRSVLRVPELAISFVLLDQILDQSSLFLDELENVLSSVAQRLSFQSLPLKSKEKGLDTDAPEEDERQNQEELEREERDLLEVGYREDKGRDDSVSPPDVQGETAKQREELQKCVERVLGLFSLWAPHFRSFGEFAARHEEARAKLQEQSVHSPSLSSFLREQAGKLGGLTIQSLLILPIQRLPRYVLLLRELEKRKEELLPSSLSPLKEALRGMEGAVQAVNDAVRKREDKLKMIDLQGRFLAGALSSIPVLLVPGRNLIHEGFLTKVRRRSAGKRNSHRAYYFHLFSDLLIYSEIKDGEKFYPHQLLPLDRGEVSVSEAPDTGSIRNAFQVTTTLKSVLLYAENKREKETWISLICRAINGCHSATPSDIKSSLSSAGSSQRLSSGSAASSISSIADEEGDKESRSSVSSASLKAPLSPEQSKEKITAIEAAFSSNSSSRSFLRLPALSSLSRHRLFVREGPLFVLQKDGPKMHQFFLLSDCLVHGEVVGSNRYKHQGTILLKDVEILRRREMPDNVYAFEILEKHGKERRSLLVCAMTWVAQQEWIADISQWVEQCSRDQQFMEPTTELHSQASASKLLEREGPDQGSGLSPPLSLRGAPKNGERVASTEKKKRRRAKIEKPKLRPAPPPPPRDEPLEPSSREELGLKALSDKIYDALCASSSATVCSRPSQTLDLTSTSLSRSLGSLLPVPEERHRSVIDLLSFAAVLASVRFINGSLSSPSQFETISKLAELINSRAVKGRETLKGRATQRQNGERDPNVSSNDRESCERSSDNLPIEEVVLQNSKTAKQERDSDENSLEDRDRFSSSLSLSPSPADSREGQHEMASPMAETFPRHLFPDVLDVGERKTYSEKAATEEKMETSEKTSSSSALDEKQSESLSTLVLKREEKGDALSMVTDQENELEKPLSQSTTEELTTSSPERLKEKEKKRETEDIVDIQETGKQEKGEADVANSKEDKEDCDRAGKRGHTDEKEQQLISVQLGKREMEREKEEGFPILGAAWARMHLILSTFLERCSDLETPEEVSLSLSSSSSSSAPSSSLVKELIEVEGTEELRSRVLPSCTIVHIYAYLCSSLFHGKGTLFPASLRPQLFAWHKEYKREMLGLNSLTSLRSSLSSLSFSSKERALLMAFFRLLYLMEMQKLAQPLFLSHYIVATESEETAGDRQERVQEREETHAETAQTRAQKEALEAFFKCCIASYEWIFRWTGPMPPPPRQTRKSREEERTENEKENEDRVSQENGDEKRGTEEEKSKLHPRKSSAKVQSTSLSAFLSPSSSLRPCWSPAHGEKQGEMGDIHHCLPKAPDRPPPLPIVTSCLSHPCSQPPLSATDAVIGEGACMGELDKNDEETIRQREREGDSASGGEEDVQQSKEDQEGQRRRRSSRIPVLSRWPLTPPGTSSLCHFSPVKPRLPLSETRRDSRERTGSREDIQTRQSREIEECSSERDFHEAHDRANIEERQVESQEGDPRKRRSSKIPVLVQRKSSLRDEWVQDDGDGVRHKDREAETELLAENEEESQIPRPVASPRKVRERMAELPKEAKNLGVEREGESECHEEKEEDGHRVSPSKPRRQGSLGERARPFVRHCCRAEASKVDKEEENSREARKRSQSVKL